MFGKIKIKNSNVCKEQYEQFQWLEKSKRSKGRNQEFQCLEDQNQVFDPMFKKDEIKNSNVWKN